MMTLADSESCLTPPTIATQSHSQMKWLLEQDWLIPLRR